MTTVHVYNDTRIFHKQCVSLVNEGYEVYLLATVEKDFSEFGVSVVSLGVAKSRLHRVLNKVPKTIIKALRMKASIYHIHDPELLFAIPFLRMSGANVIYDIHEDYVTSINEKPHIPKYIRSVVSLLFAVFEKLMGNFCSKIIAERYYARRFPNSTGVYNYPIVADSERFGRTCEFCADYSWFLYTGNVTEARGALLQLELLNIRDDVAIAYIGQCSKMLESIIKDWVEKRGIVKERILIIGVDEYVPRKVIDHYTSMPHWKAGLAVFPKSAHYEEKELTKFFEYMHMGLPILCSDFPVWKKLVEATNTGRVVDVENLYAYAGILDFFIVDGHEVAEIKKAGPIAVADRFNWKREEEKLFSLYKSLIY